MLARTLPAPTPARIFFAIEFTRYLDRSDSIRFRSFRFYAEEGLARKARAGQHVHQHAQDRLSGYGAGLVHDRLAQDNKHITEVKNPRLIETGYQSSQFCCKIRIGKKQGGGLKSGIHEVSSTVSK